MNLIRLPIPDQYIYLDTDKVISMEFNAYNGELIISLLGEYTRTFHEGSKRILDAIIEATNCKSGIPSIPKVTKPVSSTTYEAAPDYYEVTPL